METNNKPQLGTAAIDWNNVDLTSPYESSQSILDAYTFDDVLLEIECNLRDINEKTVRDEFEQHLKERVRSAREIFEANLKNILAHAIKDRNIDAD